MLVLRLFLRLLKQPYNVTKGGVVLDPIDLFCACHPFACSEMTLLHHLLHTDCCCMVLTIAFMQSVGVQWPVLYNEL